MAGVPLARADRSPHPQFLHEQIIGAPWFRHQGQIFTIYGDTWVGFESVRLHPEGGYACNVTTEVIRKHRGQGIGLALKVLAARYARRSGFAKVATDNDSLNAPVPAINREMGYEPEPGKFLLKMDWPADQR